MLVQSMRMGNGEEEKNTNKTQEDNEKRKMPEFTFRFKDMSESCFFGITNLIMVDFEHTQTSTICLL